MMETETISARSRKLGRTSRFRLRAAGCADVQMIGNNAILDGQLVGLFCSKQCPGDAVLRAFNVIRAIRDAGVTVIGGFHSPMESECLDLLLRGSQPVIICPARAIDRMRIPADWRQPIEDGRLLILSRFESKHRSPTVRLADQRNEFVASVSDVLLVAHAAAGSRTEALCQSSRDAGKNCVELSGEDKKPLAGNDGCKVSIAAFIRRLKQASLNENEK